MNQVINPVFAFKDIFIEEDAKRVSSRLVHYPFIWDLLSIEELFSSAFKLFGSEPQEWNPKNFILNIDNISSDVHLKSKLDHSKYYQSALQETKDIFKNYQKILEKRNNNSSWKNTLSDLVPFEHTEKKTVRLWQFIFSVILSEESERAEIEQVLIEKSNENPRFLAALLINYEDRGWIYDFLFHNQEYFLNNNLREFKRLITNLEIIGGKALAHDLVKRLINDPKILKRTDTIYKRFSTGYQVYGNIEKINNLKYLSEYVNDKEKKTFFEDISKELFSKTLNIKPLRSYEDNKTFELDDLLSLEKYSSIGQNNSDFVTLENKPIIDELLQAFNFAGSDKGSAREMCKHFLQMTKKNKIENVIFSQEFGYIIDPIDISKLLINVGLITEAIHFLENVNSLYPNQANINKFLAHYSNCFGDHKRALKYYSYLFALNKLSRSEKVLFCRTLEYLELWQEVLSVRSTINSLSVNDTLAYAFAAYKAENENKLEEIIDELISKYPKNKIVKIMSFLLFKTNQADVDIDVYLNAFIKNRNKDIGTIKLIEKLLLERGKFNRASALIKSLPAKFKNHPEIQLLIYKVQMKMGSINNSLPILTILSKSETVIRQEVFEEIINLLLDRNLMIELKMFLRSYRGKWPLSTTAIYAKSFILMEEKEYSSARNQVISLLNDEKINEDVVTLFGCSLIETTLGDFPYRESTREVLTNEKNRFIELVERLPIGQKSLINEIIKIEICADNIESKYTDLLTRTSINNDRESWRVPFGLGCLFFKNKQFDQAIIYLKESLKKKPTHPVILDLLIRSYSQLKLPFEAINIIKFQSKENHISIATLTRYSDFLFEYDEFKKFLESKQMDDLNGLTYAIALIKVYTKLGDYKNAELLLTKIESVKSTNYGQLPTIAQCYLDCGDKLSSKRVIEKLLSMNREIDTKSLVESAAIYYQLGELKRSLNLIISIKDAPLVKTLAEVDILIQERKIEQATNTVEEIISNINKIESSKNISQNGTVKIPDNWNLDLSRIYKLAIGLQLRSKNYEKAFDLAGKGHEIFPYQKYYRDITYKISYLLSKNEGNNNLLENYNSEKIALCGDLDPLIAEIALENNQEIVAAKIISESNSEKDNAHVLSIKTRLLIRNGQKNEADDLYQLLLSKNLLSTDTPANFDSKGLSKLITQIAVCETAIEMDDLETGLRMSKRIYQDFGIINKNKGIYLKIIAGILERNRIFEKLNIRYHLYRVTEEDLDLLKIIRDDTNFDFLRDNDFMIRANAIIFGNKEDLEKASALHPSSENISAVILALMGLNRQEDAEKAMNLVKNNEEAFFVFAMTILDQNPEKALTIILRILEKNNSRPDYYAGLSKVYEKLNLLSESYSAISLALNIWPEEYEWEIKASELSKKMGNNLAAVTHFRNAESLNQSQKGESLIENTKRKYISLSREDFLSSKLTNTAKDVPILIELINILLEENHTDKIASYLKMIQDYRVRNNEISMLKAKFAYKTNDIQESMRIVEEVLSKSPLNIEALKLKAKIIAEQRGRADAINFIDTILASEKNKDLSDLIIQKTRYIKEDQGLEVAIDYLKKEIISGKNAICLLIYIARLLLLKGSSLDAQKFAEEALNIDVDDAELLSLLSNISSDLGDLDKAIDYMIRSLTNDPFQGKNYISLSKYFDARRDHKRALDILNEGIVILPMNYSLLRYTGLWLYKTGNYEEANTILEKAYKMNDNDPDLKQIIRLLNNSQQIKMKKIS